MKILQFGEDKCHKIHVGKDSTVCPALTIDKWKVNKGEQLETNKSSVDDIHDGFPYQRKLWK